MLYYDVLTDKCYYNGVEITIEQAEAIYQDRGTIKI